MTETKTVYRCFGVSLLPVDWAEVDRIALALGVPVRQLVTDALAEYTGLPAPVRKPLGTRKNEYSASHRWRLQNREAHRRHQEKKNAKARALRRSPVWQKKMKERKEATAHVLKKTVTEAGVKLQLARALDLLAEIEKKNEERGIVLPAPTNKRKKIVWRRKNMPLKTEQSSEK